MPEDIAIVGFDEIDFASQSSIPPTSISQPRHLIGERAVELLFDEIDSEPGHVHSQVVFPPELVARQSTVPR